MKKLLLLFWLAAAFWLTPASFAQAPVAEPPATAGTDASSAANRTTQAAAANATLRGAEPRTPDLLEHLVDSILSAFDIRTSENTVTHYAISAFLLVIALLARRIVTGIVFKLLRNVAARTTTTLDDKLFAALEGPAAAFVVVVGVFASLKVLKLSEAADLYISSGSRVAFSLTIFWCLWRAIRALLEHAEEMSAAKELGVTAFMPWIRKSLMTVLVVIGVLLTIQSLGYDVKAILAGLGIGGLAFALAAQDTLANIFGAIVVAIDQPFKVGEFVQIGANAGAVEDIGLRSTRLRRSDKSLLIIPNKTVAAEVVVNLARFTKRRFEQVIALTYDTTPEKMQAIVEDIRGIIRGDAEVDPGSVMVFFRDFSASSMDVWIVYEARGPDFQKSMHLKQRLNLAFMRAIEARGLRFAVPTQSIRLEGKIAEQLAGKAPADQKRE